MRCSSTRPFTYGLFVKIYSCAHRITIVALLASPVFNCFGFTQFLQVWGMFQSCALVPSRLLRMTEWKGLESCLLRARPRFQAQQYGGRHGSQRVSSELTIWPIPWISTRKSGSWFGTKHLILSWETFPDVNMNWKESGSGVWQHEGSLAA